MGNTSDNKIVYYYLTRKSLQITRETSSEDLESIRHQVSSEIPIPR